MNTRITLALFGVCLTGLLAASLAQADTIRFTTINYCPFTCDPAAEDGREGIMTDVARFALERAGHTLDITMLPYVRAVQAAQDGTADGILVVGNDYAPDLVFPDHPTLRQRVAFLAKAGTAWRYTGVASLPAVRVGIVDGYHYIDADLMEYLLDKANAAQVLVLRSDNTTEQGINMLMKDRMEVYLEGEFSAQYVLTKLGLQDVIEPAGYTATAFDDYTAFSPHNPQAAEYARLISEALAELSQSGQLQAICANYGIQKD